MHCDIPSVLEARTLHFKAMRNFDIFFLHLITLFLSESLSFVICQWQWPHVLSW